TGQHHWLATSFIPGDIIDDVMAQTLSIHGASGGFQYLETKPEQNIDEPFTPPQIIIPPRPEDILDQKNLKVGDKDYAGYKILVNDIEQGIVVSEITGNGYKGKIMLIDDPARVFIGNTFYPEKQGTRIKDMMEEYGAVAGINASGFNDLRGGGTGGEVVGFSISNGESWGYYVDYYGSVVLTNTHKLVVGYIDETDWKNYNIRDGIQFSPVLIADGEKYADGSNGFGIQPRTAIGQREDGVIVFLVIDGRDALHSLGCTVGELANILLKYDVINAACCDGGASSVLAYKGKVITQNSSANPEYGRRIPNAFLVKTK
ncbi:MAG: phosphodiester glycosidase family protein, partial [Oscillospiraceae bacterium]|nr:phosphodiester glycosidase family protein [Oscillospiraceae bacterium]